MIALLYACVVLPTAIQLRVPPAKIAALVVLASLTSYGGTTTDPLPPQPVASVTR